MTCSLCLVLVVLLYIYCAVRITFMGCVVGVDVLHLVYNQFCMLCVGFVVRWLIVSSLQRQEFSDDEKEAEAHA